MQRSGVSGRRSAYSAALHSYTLEILVRGKDFGQCGERRKFGAWL
jgi:hypothetical protein